MSSRTPCHFFLAGNCRKGSRCRFFHDVFSSIPANIMADAIGEETSISPGHRGDTQASASTSTSTSSSSTARPAYAAVRPCQWYMAGYCLRGDSCWFSHDRAWIDPSYGRNDTVAVDDSEDEDEDEGAAVSSRAREDSDHETEGQKCAICFEEPSTFGLLVSCNHAFCLTCIRTWRAKDIAPDMHPQDRNGSVTKACPNCRTPSLYIVPSSYFPASPEQKEIIIRNYKEATARRPCKHFKESGDLHWCPFGDSCFFAHQDENGEPCKVNPESDPRRRRRQQRHHHNHNYHHPHHTHFGGGGRNRNFAGQQHPSRSSRYAPEETFELRTFFAGLTGVDDLSEMDIEALRVVFAELTRPSLESNYSSLGHDLVDLDEDDFDDDDDDGWEDEEDDDDDDDDDDEDDDYDEGEDETDIGFDDDYRLLLHYLHHHPEDL